MTTTFRRNSLANTLLALILSLPLGAASAQPFSAGKSIRMIVPLSAGSTVDVVARIMGNQLSQVMGHSMIIENLPGAGGVPGTGQLVRAPKDGSVLGMVSSNHVINPGIYKSMPFDSIKDITPITILGTVPMVLVVNPAVPAKNLKELIALAKAQPGVLNYGSAGNGSVLHLAAELLRGEAGIDIKHIPYKGTGPMAADLLGNQVQLAFVSVSIAAPHIKTGKLRALGVSTASRSAFLPNVPTLVEQGLPNYSLDSWIALIGPAGLPKDLVAKYSSQIRTALGSKEVRDGLAAQGIAIIGNTPDEAAQFFQSELAKHMKLVSQSGASID